MKDETIGYIFLLLLLLGVGGLLAANQGAFSSESVEGPRGAPLAALEVDLEALDLDKVALGRQLFHDGILSGDGSISCATCHVIEAGGAEPRRVSIGVEGAVGPINSPTVLNARHHIAQFWDGRAATLQEQAGGPVQNQLEMRADFPTVIERIEGEPAYAQSFADLYPEGVTQDSITDAIATYVSSLETPAPFDRWVAGDDEALSEQAQRGFETFRSVGCTTCHDGVNVGGGSFQKMGLVHDYFEERGGRLTEADLGRFNVTGEEEDRHVFRVPTLRNITRTAPYFHDGSAETLSEAIRTMGHVQLGQDLDDEQVSDIEAFLQSLDGELPAHASLQPGEERPERSYALPVSYDVRVERSKEAGADKVLLLGKVRDEEARAALVAMASERFTAGVDATGLTIDPSAADTSGDGFGICMGKALDAMVDLDRGRVDFDLTPLEGDELKLSFVGEGSDEAMSHAEQLFSSLPEGYGWSKPLLLVDHDAVAGCDARLAAVQETQRIHFNTASAILDEESEELLEDVGDVLASCPTEVRLRIDGHTDAQGDEGMNLHLSRLRAAAVRDVLTQFGVAPERLLSHGYGETRPRGDNTTAEGRQRNRRIELHLDRVGSENYTPNVPAPAEEEAEAAPEASAVRPPRPPAAPSAPAAPAEAAPAAPAEAPAEEE